MALDNDPLSVFLILDLEEERSLGPPLVAALERYLEDNSWISDDSSYHGIQLMRVFRPIGSGLYVATVWDASDEVDDLLSEAIREKVISFAAGFRLALVHARTLPSQP